MTSSSITPYTSLFTRSLDLVERDLKAYASLLRKWQAVQNLVSRETLPELWTRHFADSLQVLKFLSSDDTLLLDLGSGGGFPALPLAIATKGSERRYVLVEPTSRKASFLRTVARELDLNVTIIARRIEEIDSRETGVPNVITSRALANLGQLYSRMAPFFGSSTRALLHKGAEHVEELREAGALWDSNVLVRSSDTDPRGVLLEVSKLRART